MDIFTRMESCIRTAVPSVYPYTNVAGESINVNRLASNLCEESSENGCLQIIPGSHHLGRLNHGRSGDLASIDEERMEAIMTRLGKPVLAQTDPGDVLFFHRFNGTFVV